MIIEPQTARFQIVTTSDGLRAIIPARRNLFIMLFLFVWLGGWGVGEVNASRELLSAKATTSTAFLSFWLVVWTIGGAFAFTTILWQIAGREVITVNPSTLSYRVEIFGLGRTRSYRAIDVRSLRATEYSMNPANNQSAWYPPLTGSRNGLVAFDYGARTIRLAPSLEEAEAKLLVRSLSSILPNSRNKT